MNHHLPRHRLAKAGTPAPSAPLYAVKDEYKMPPFDPEERLAAALKAARGEVHEQQPQDEHIRFFQGIMVVLAIVSAAGFVYYMVRVWLI